MSKTVTITLTEKQYNTLKLCFWVGNIMKDSIEVKTQSEILEQMELFQLLDKAAYDVKLEGSGIDDGLYYHGAEIEDEMLSIIERYDKYIESGAKSEEMEAIRKQIESRK